MSTVQQTTAIRKGKESLAQPDGRCHYKYWFRALLNRFTKFVCFLEFRLAFNVAYLSIPARRTWPRFFHFKCFSK